MHFSLLFHPTAAKPNIIQHMKDLFHLAVVQDELLCFPFTTSISINPGLPHIFVTIILFIIHVCWTLSTCSFPAPVHPSLSGSGTQKAGHCARHHPGSFAL